MEAFTVNSQCPYKLIVKIKWHGTALNIYSSYSLVVGMQKLPAMQEMQIRSMDQEDPLEEGMTTHSSILAWEIPLTEEPGGYSPWSHKESDMT